MADRGGHDMSDSLLRRAGLHLHKAFAWHRLPARAYLAGWNRALAALPDGWLKEHCRNNLFGVRWPEARGKLDIDHRCRGLRGRFRPATNDLTFRFGLFRDRLAHEREVFDFLAPRMAAYDAVIEVGANVGAYTVFFGKTAPRVFAFEPSPGTYAKLCENLALNGLTNVTVTCAAVTTRPEPLELDENRLNLMSHSLEAELAARFAGAGHRTPVARADPAALVSAVRPFSRVLLKVDVVGTEAEALEALRPYLEGSRPDLILGVWDANCPGLNALAWLTDRYRLARIDPGGPTPRAAFADARYCNYFLMPKGPH